jgi:tetratricopeptide (TPR) repeat protein
MQPLVAQTQSVNVFLQKLSAEKDENKRIFLIIDFLANTAEVDPVLDLKNSQKILQYAQKNKDKISEVMALSNIAYDYRAMGNTALSLELHLKANAIALETGNEKLLANAQLNLGHIYKDQANYTKAISLYSSAAEIANRQKDIQMQFWAYGNLGAIYIETNQLDSALIYTQQSYAIGLKGNDPFFFDYILSNLAIIQGRLGNKDLALSYFNMALANAVKTNSSRYINLIYTSLAEYYFNIHQQDSGFHYAKKAIGIVKNTALSNKTIKPAKLLLDNYENINGDSAIKYFKIYKAANDSLFSAKVIQQTQVMTFENEMRQQELLAEKMRSKEERQQNIQFALIAFGIITFIVLFLLFSRSIVANERFISFFGVLGLLIVFEFINLLFHPWLASVTHESPVLMLLALVLIASLLIPLHHRLEKWIKEKMVEKNKAIRLAAAKKTIEELEKK